MRTNIMKAEQKNATAQSPSESKHETPLSKAFAVIAEAKKYLETYSATNEKLKQQRLLILQNGEMRLQALSKPPAEQAIHQILLDILCDNVIAVIKHADIRKTKYGKLHEAILTKYPQLAVELYFYLSTQVFFYRNSCHRVQWEDILNDLPLEAQNGAIECFNRHVKDKVNREFKRVNEAYSVKYTGDQFVARLFVVMAYHEKEEFTAKKIQQLFYVQSTEQGYVMAGSLDEARFLFCSQCIGTKNNYVALEIYLTIPDVTPFSLASCLKNARIVGDINFECYVRDESAKKWLRDANLNNKLDPRN